MKSPSPTFVAGNVIAGRYRIEGLLGQGGFGVVYRAIHVEHRREVALKVLRSGLFAQADARERFLREAELAKRLTHPNTVRIYDFGADEGAAYIACEMLPGQPLSSVIKAEGPLPAARVAHIALQVLASLMEAHAMGIIHRDIKPANVFLCDFPGAPGFVKVLDFGIAKANLPPGQSMQALTQAGEMLGTPHYMAPEQAYGYTITHAVDLYALGIMMSEALAGAPVLRGTAMEVVMAQVSASPLPHRPEVLQSALGPVIQRATQKDPASRYGSAEEMLRHIESAHRALTAGPSPAGPASGPVPSQPAISGPHSAISAPHPAIPASQPVILAPPPALSASQSVIPASQPAFSTPAPAIPATNVAPNMPAPPPILGMTPGPAPTHAGMQPTPMYAPPVAPARGGSPRVLTMALMAAFFLLLGGGAMFLWMDPGEESRKDRDTNARGSKDPAVAAIPTPASSPDPTAGRDGGTQPRAKAPAGGSSPSVQSPGGASPSGAGSAGPAPTASAPSEAGGGAKFDGGLASISMDAAYKASRPCYSGPPLGVSVVVKFGKDGRAASVQVLASIAHTPAGKCIENNFRACSTKPYDEPELRSVVKTFSY